MVGLHMMWIPTQSFLFNAVSIPLNLFQYVSMMHPGEQTEGTTESSNICSYGAGHTIDCEWVKNIDQDNVDQNKDSIHTTEAQPLLWRRPCAGYK